MIIGSEDGCEIIYSHDHQVKIKKSSSKASKMIYGLAHSYYRPVLSTMKLIEEKHGYHQKIPVLIEFDRLLLFPTVSMKDPSCCWVNYYCVADVKGTKKKTQLSFYDHNILDERRKVCFSYALNVDKRVITRQMKRCQEIHSRMVKPDHIVELIEKNFIQEHKFI